METLCDEILLQIFKYLTPYELITISEVKADYKRLIDDKSLWIWMDGRTETPQTIETLAYLNEKVSEQTAAYMVNGSDPKLPIITKELVTKWADFTSLTILALENQQFDGEIFKLTSFPASLIELSLNKSHIQNYYPFFKSCSKQLVNLKVLTLEHCQVVEEHILLPLGNLPELEILSLNRCLQMKDDIVPVTMGCEYGFKKLKVLDLRATGFGNEILRLTSKLNQLGELYFHGFELVHEQEQQEEADCAAGSSEEKFRYFNVLEYNFSDGGLVHYRKSASRPEGYEAPASVLYRRPFAPCTCRKTRKQVDLTLPSTSTGCCTASKRPHAADDDGFDDVSADRKRPRWSTNSRYVRACKKDTVFYKFEDGTTVVREQNPPPSFSEKCVIALNLVRDNREPRLVANVEEALPQRDREWNVIYVHHGGVRCIRANPHAFERTHSIAINSLMLRGSKGVTDFGLNSLKQLNLDLLDVTNTSVTEKGLASFQKSMPHCRIVHETLCTCRPR